MWVVKLGGSLIGAGSIGRWADALADSDVPVIICPGGGPFADQVRVAYRRWPLGDAAAHRMAILAMEQSAYLLQGLCPRLIRAVDSGIRVEPDSQRRALLWFPATELMEDGEIPCSWAITSDSLAAVLARRIGAQGLVLVKAAPIPHGAASVDSLQQGGLLDTAFAVYGAGCGCPVWLVPGADTGGFDRLVKGSPAGLRVLFEPCAPAVRPQPGDRLGSAPMG